MSVNQGKILVVDDEDIIRDILRIQLTWQGHTVITVSGGFAALEMLEQQQFDLVLVDMMMPDLSGIEVLRQIKVRPNLRHIPVVVISADHDLERVAVCIELGAEDYLFKPFNRVLLHARITACLERQRLRSQEQFLLHTRLARLGDHQVSDELLDSSQALDSATTSLLDELEEAQRRRSQAEEELRALNATLEQRVAERSAVAEQRAEELSRQTEILRSILNSIGDAIIVVDESGHLLHTNPAAQTILSLSEILSHKSIKPRLFLPDQPMHYSCKWLPLARAIQGEAVDSAELFLQATKDYESQWLSVTARPIRDIQRGIVGGVAVFRDITATKQLESRLRNDALHDSLTELPNRIMFIEHLTHAITRCRYDPTATFAILFLDLDRFKIINDSLGHLVGDQLLVNIARRLEGCVRSEDLIARFGGDEFTILLNNADAQVAISVAERIHHALSTPFHLDSHEVFTSASIGITLGNTEYNSPNDMLRDADIAMYEAKNNGKARHVLFDAAMYNRAMTQLQLETDLRYAIEYGQFRMHYQPIVALASHQIVGFEALIRWEHSKRGIIPPSEFIPLAEETGLIIPIGQWVLRESCRQLRDWQQSFPQSQSLTMSVNLSGKQFAQPDLVSFVAETLCEMDLRPQNLKLEITESSLIEHNHVALSVLSQLRNLGIKICIDDFGTGYSSLSYLHRFPIDTLKIDRSFVNWLDSDIEQIGIVRAIVSMAQMLNLDVVAEGTETTEQLAQLQALNCDYGQGWLFSRALDEDAATALIASLQSPNHRGGWCPRVTRLEAIVGT